MSSNSNNNAFENAFGPIAPTGAELARLEANFEAPVEEERPRSPPEEIDDEKRNQQ